MSPQRDRLTRERDRLSRVWEVLTPEQGEMATQSDKLNSLTKQLEGLRTKLRILEEVHLEMGYKSEGFAKQSKAEQDNAMSREEVLVQTCNVENQIKDALDIMEKLLDREKKRLHKELERVRMEKFWNLAGGLRRRNQELSPIEKLWADEVDKLDGDLLKVRELRTMCWQRMHVDAQKLDALRLEERARQERQERQEHYQRQEQKQSRHREEERKGRQDQSYAGYFTDAGAWAQRDRKPTFMRPDAKTKASLEDAKLLVAWRAYQLRWTTAMSPKSKDSQLTYGGVPWPVAEEPYFPSTLTPSRIADFLLSPLHSNSKSHTERLRDAMKMWHPDKWEGKFMERVAETERPMVREGLGMVARALIELLHDQRKFDR